MVTQAERRSRTKANVVEAAIHAFDAAGDVSPSLEDIAALAGVAKSTIVYHFGSRIGLLQAVAQDIFLRAQRAVTDHPPAGTAPWIAALLRSQADSRARVLQAIDDELSVANAFGDADPLPWLVEHLGELGLADADLAAAAVLQVARRVAYGLIGTDEIDAIARRLSDRFT